MRIIHFEQQTMHKPQIFFTNCINRARAPPVPGPRPFSSLPARKIPEEAKKYLYRPRLDRYRYKTQMRCALHAGSRRNV